MVTPTAPCSAFRPALGLPRRRQGQSAPWGIKPSPFMSYRFFMSVSLLDRRLTAVFQQFILHKMSQRLGETANLATQVTALQYSVPYPTTSPLGTKGSAHFGKIDGCSSPVECSSPNPAHPKRALAGGPTHARPTRLESPATCKHPAALKRICPVSFVPNGFAFGALLRPKSQERSAEGESQWLGIPLLTWIRGTGFEALRNYQSTRGRV